MASTTYDIVFVGGGLAALLLLRQLRHDLPARIAVVDPTPPADRPTVHWSYWSGTSTPYDPHVIGSWRRARASDGPPQDIAPYTLQVVESATVLADLIESLQGLPIEWLTDTVRMITRIRDGRYAVDTTTGTLHARWVFDSACRIPPVFPHRRPSAMVSGTGLRVTCEEAVFDSTTATLFDPIDDRTFAYLLPFSAHEALLESASFGSAPSADDTARLLGYLDRRHPGMPVTVTHEEHGEIPLGFPARRTAGPHHVLLGTKRGLVKPSAGYGVVRIARESEYLARRWAGHRRLPATRRAAWRWRVVDEQFLRLAARDPGGPLMLLSRTLRSVPLAQALRLIDEDLVPGELVRLLRFAAPALSR
jgi:lycopene beta-cyclase